MRNFIFHRTLLILSVCMLVFSACKKEEPPPDNNDTDATLDFAFANNAFTDAGNIADQSEDGSVDTYKNGGILSQCATVTINLATKHITVDFGNSNCLCYDGRYRRGILYVDYTGPFHTPGNSYVVSFNNYYVNDHKILGTRTVTNLGPNGANNPTFSVVDSNGQIIKPNNGGTILWNSHRTNEWAEGDTTLNWADDVWLVSGNATGTSAAGVNFTADITTPLRVEVGCRWITAGVFDFTPSQQVTRTINYGTGACDSLASLTVAGYTANIVLP